MSSSLASVDGNSMSAATTAGNSITASGTYPAVGAPLRRSPGSSTSNGGTFTGGGMSNSSVTGGGMSGPSPSNAIVMHPDVQAQVDQLLTRVRQHFPPYLIIDFSDPCAAAR
jgi:hypothetical protein